MSDLLYEQFDKVVKITMNRPEKRNAMNHAIIQGMHDAFDKAAADDSVSVVIVAGAGEKAFTAGFDLKESMGEAITDVVDRRADTKAETDLWMKIWKMPKPVIAQIHGYCIGGGITIAMISDLCIAGDNLKLGNPELVLGYISNFPVSPYKLPFNKARELALIGDFWSAEDLKQFGVANRVFPYEQLAEETMKIAQRISQTPLFSLSMMKQEMNKVYENMGFLNSMDYAAEMFNLARLHMIATTGFGKDVQDKGLKAALETRYNQ